MRDDLGQMAEWLKAADCKSADVRLRRFESYPLHHYDGCGWRPGSDTTLVRFDPVGKVRRVERRAGVAQW